jgi:hypothetical protein
MKMMATAALLRPSSAKAGSSKKEVMSPAGTMNAG